MTRITGPRTESGRWIRRGGRILVLPADGGTPGTGEPPATRVGSPRRSGLQGEVGGRRPAYTVCDFIDPRIDVAAQYALFEMMRSDSFTRTVARGLFATLKGGRLGGIYQEDQRVPAKRAQELGKGWWKLIPEGSSVACIREPSSKLPIVVFRRSLAKDPAGLRSALVDAWFACQIPTLGLPLPPASGKPCTRPASSLR